MASYDTLGWTYPFLPCASIKPVAFFHRAISCAIIAPETQDVGTQLQNATQSFYSLFHQSPLPFPTQFPFLRDHLSETFDAWHSALRTVNNSIIGPYFTEPSLNSAIQRGVMVRSDVGAVSPYTSCSTLDFHPCADSVKKI